MVPNNTNNIQNPFSTPPITSTSTEVYEKPITVQESFDSYPDPFSDYVKHIKINPGKTLYIIILISSLLLTLFPWFKIGSETFFYYSLIGRNIFTLLYVLGLIFLLFTRILIWYKAKFPTNILAKILPILEYFEIVISSAILMFIITLNIFGTIHIGIILSIFTNIGIFSYLTYLKLFKRNI